MDDHDQGAIDAKPDGQFLHDWFEANGIGRSVAFAMVKIVQSRGIEPERQRQANATKASVFLSGQFLAAMDALAAEHKNGMSVSQLEAKYTTAIATTPAAAVAQQPLDSDALDPALLMRRLKAAKLAIETGLPLTRKEVSWIVGFDDPTRLTPTRIRVGRTSLRKWTLLAPTSENLMPERQAP